MKFNEVENLLKAITSIDRRPFPDGAALTWLPVLQDIDYRDALQAVLDHYGQTEGAPSVLPGQVRARARRIAEQRQRAERPALEAAPTRPAAQTRSEAFLRARAEIRAKLAEGSARIHAKDPGLRPYKHRRATLTRVG